jgi:hypothetical protein
VISGKSYTRIDLEMERDQYFQIMAVCLTERLTMDEFIVSAVMNLIAKQQQLNEQDATYHEEQITNFSSEGNPNE